MEPFDVEEKLRLMCSHGGRFLPRDGQRGDRGRLRYVGGETRVVSLQRRSSLRDLLLKLSRLLSPTSPFCLKYQLPSQEALHPLSSSDDLRHMLLQHDRLLSLPTPSRLRLFLLPLDPSPLDSLLDLDNDREEERVAPDTPPVVDAESSSSGTTPSLASLPLIQVDLLPATSSATAVNFTVAPSPLAISPTEAPEYPFRELLLERSLLHFQETNLPVSLESKGTQEISHDSGGNKLQSQLLKLPEQCLQQQQYAHQSPSMAGTKSMPLQSLFYPVHNNQTHQSPPNDRCCCSQTPMFFTPVQPNVAYSAIPLPQVDIGGIPTAPGKKTTTRIPPSSTIISGQGIAPPALKPESAVSGGTYQTSAPSFTVARLPPIPQFLHTDRKHKPHVGYHPINQHSSQSTLAVPMNSPI